MAEKKHRSQAEKAAATKSRQKAPQKSNSKKDMQQKNGNKTEIPVRVITSIIFIVLFILFIFLLIEPKGAVIRFFRSVVFGLIVLTLLPGFARIRETYMQNSFKETVT